MNHPIRSICLVLAAALALGFAQAIPGGAQDAKKTATDCSKTDSMIMQPDTSVQASGDVDKDFAQTMTMHNSRMMAMEKAELACGKDAKTKAMAQKLLNQAAANAAELKQLLGGGH
jgi:uncharacterized protein (DUF305 family)